MGFETKVLADSVSDKGIRLTTVEATYPRIIHSELMTHRVFSRNSASTRAIPLSNHLQNLLTKPFVPEKFGINQPGMQAYNHLAGMKHDQAVEVWLAGRDRALTTTLELILGREVMADVLDYDPKSEFVNGTTLYQEFGEIQKLLPKSTDEIDLAETSMLNVHKQLAGRGLEAYMWHKVIITSTDWDNYFGLRDHPEAQGEIAESARVTKQAISASEPKRVGIGEWHLPLVDEGEFDNSFDGIRASAARTAAVSYNRHSAKNPEKEFSRYQDLRSGGHMSPLEHQATPFDYFDWRIIKAQEEVLRDIIAVSSLKKHYDKHTENVRYLGNLRGWVQHRKQVPYEYDFSKLRTDS
jgi:hypothetical protein